MKIKYLISLALLTLMLWSCDEIPPVVSSGSTSTGDCTIADPSVVASQQRQVLIEEFTGVRCVNCPAGSQAIEDLISIYGDQLVAISIHAGEFSSPYPESLYDFQTPAGNQLLNFLGQPLGYPTAVVNRKKFDGSSSLQIFKNKWAGNIETESMEAPEVKLAIELLFDATTSDLGVDVTLFPQVDLSNESLALSIVLTEDDITDYQETPDGKISDYKHKHVFRDAITNFSGDVILEPLTTDAVVCQSYSYNIPAEWKVADMHVIAFVSKVGGEDKDIVQAAQAKILE